jgi:putative tricarboxylic transport membrane protein
MNTIELLLQGFAACMDPLTLLLCAVGAFLGVVVGVLPGLGPQATIAILLPLIYGRSPLPTLVMLSGIYYGAQFGGSITSITLNIPGESSAVATTFDGHPLQKQGKGGKAIGIAMVSSFFGGTIATILLTFLARFMADFALKFGPPEYFSVYLFTFISILCISKGNIIKGFASLSLGLLISTVGMDVYTGGLRLDFGIMHLWGGVALIPVIIGLFGLPETILSITESEFIEIKKGDPSLNFKIKGVFPTLKEIIFCLPTMIRSMLVGFVTGVMPAAGPTLASMLTYKMEEQVASDREKFGQGSLQGVAAPEAANNAATTGCFAPMLALGIPGSSTTALLLGAFVMVGIQPGPGLFSRNPGVVWGLISSMYVGNIMLIIMCLVLVPVFLWLLRISQKTLPVIVAVICVVGTYSEQFALFDVGIMLFMAIIGLLCKKVNIPMAALITGVVLGKDFERSFRQTLGMFKGDLGLFSVRPIALVFFVLCILMIAFSASRTIKKKEKKGDIHG